MGWCQILQIATHDPFFAAWWVQSRYDLPCLQPAASGARPCGSQKARWRSRLPKQSAEHLGMFSHKKPQKATKSHKSAGKARHCSILDLPRVDELETWPVQTWPWKSLHVFYENHLPDMSGRKKWGRPKTPCCIIIFPITVDIFGCHLFLDQPTSYS